MTGVQIPKRIDVNKLKNPELLVRVKERLDGVVFDGSWENYKEQVYSAGSDMFMRRSFTKARNVLH